MSQKVSHRFTPELAELTGAQAFLRAAADHWDDTQTSDRYIQQALATEGGLDVFVSAYRYYFYKSNAPMALQMAIAVCDYIRQAQHWPDAWADLKPMLLSQIETTEARLYISAYAATGLLQARLGHLALAETIANQVQQLNAKEFGADVLLGILNPPLEEDEE